MTIDQRIQWVLLPAGLSPDGSQARFSLFVAPRLGADRAVTLADFPDFQDWPARLATASFFVVTTDANGTASDGEAGPLTVSGPAADSALWQRLFPRHTPVTPFEFDDFRKPVKVSYPARGLADTTRGAFAAAAAGSPEELPTASGMSQFAGFAPAEDMPTRLQQIAATLAAADQLAADRPDGPAEPELGPQDAFLAFHQQEKQLPTFAGPRPLDEPPPEPPPRPVPPALDFHQMLSALGDHPALLRRLGLVVDLTLPVGRLTPARGERGLAMAPRFASLVPDAASQDLTPATRYALVPGEEFCAAALGEDPLGPPARGLLALPGSEYAIEQADIDGVNLKLLAASAAASVPDDVSPDGRTPEHSAPPSLRTAGLAVVQGGRAQALQSGFRRAAAQQDALGIGGSPVLTAEDLVRGHRVDVFDESRQRWFSLHQRIVHYNPPDGDGGGPIATVTDEGFFQPGMTRPEGAAERLHVHEHLVCWDGWALSAPRPGMALVDEGPAGGDGEEPPGPRRITNRATTTLPLQIEAETPPGTLPRLRFGRSYRLRIRTVDLAGNGPSLDEAERLMDQDVLVLPSAGGEVFRRYEAVAAPTVLPRAPFTEGDSAHRLVIRSTAEQSPQQYADDFNARPPVAGGTHPPYRAVDERHLVAPKASLEAVERHGLLDAAIGSADPEARRAVYELAVRESGQLDDPSLDGIAFVDFPAPEPGPSPDGPPSGDSPEGGPPDESPPQRYVVHTGEQIELPYLPDPLSLGVVFRGLPGVPDQDPFEVPWAGPDWSTPKSLRLRLVEGTGPPQLDAAARVLTVALPKAAVRTVRVCSKAVANEKILGMLHWCREALGDGEQFEKVMGAARANRHWMTTPWHELTLTHAVQRPLLAPALTLFDITGRGLGDTGEHLAGFFELDAPSTERIDLVAHWTEEIDDLAEPGPRTRDLTAPVFRLPLALAVPFGPGVDVNNVPSTLDGNQLFFSTGAAAAVANDPGSVPPPPEMQEFGDTKHRQVTYRPVATTPFGDCFPPEFAADPEQKLLAQWGEPVPHTVLSSSRPAVPQVLDCLPTLAFETSGSLPGTLTRHRRGGGLRLYLARPWFTSGSGELLAVLVPEEGEEPSEGAYPFITLMGRDPAHRSAPVTLPTPAHFPGAERVRSGLVLPDPDAFFPGFTVTAVGFRPQFAEESGRWVCDLDVDLGDAYLPFVRLALARFQPDSLEGEHLSPIVHTPVLRTLPDRVLTVEGTDPLTVRLSGPNYLSDFTVGGGVSPEVSVSLLQRDPEVPDDAVAWRKLDETEILLDPEDTSRPDQTYAGEFSLPSPLPPGPLRLLVTESAVSGSDFAVSELFGPLGTQVIYADTVPL
ncbi:hypothetical protein ACGF4C_17985 [Streptomyces sp. NPDC048197]|uniref:hypothetical protein n=1 Tax=Streptomyces sp. NPDC048197 TaxID=3365511 RepID=UPI00371C4520